ncbi:MAG: acyl-ACP--UDP-N-acetylglucosamine O-acyltransferase [Pyramidobacter sp.]|jgi:UDP-N-acetylglucosamine acyltransferase
MGIQIHPSAIVSPHAEIADGAVIGPYCIVDEKVTIGARTVLRPYVHVCPYTKIGSDSILYEHSVLGPEPQDHAFKGETSWVVIGDYTEIRENVTIHRASGESMVTKVGDHCLIMEGVHLGHNVQIDDYVTISSKCGFAGYAEVGRYAVIGGMSGFHQFVRVGSYCMVGGASRVAQDVPPFLLANGSPCRIFSLNVIGLRRNGFSSERRLEIKRAYKKLYHSGKPMRSALADLEADQPESPDVQEIIAFFKGGDKKRGFCAWPFALSRRTREEE